MEKKICTAKHTNFQPPDEEFFVPSVEQSVALSALMRLQKILMETVQGCILRIVFSVTSAVTDAPAKRLLT
jgi:hypothetical protein